MSSAVVGLFGRDEEMRAIRSFLRAAASDGGALLITGPTGIGKTAVLDEAVRSASAGGGQVLTAACVEDEADLPFAGLSQLLAPVMDTVVGLDAPHRETLLPALEHGRLGNSSPTAVVAALMAALEAAAADRSVLIAVDDLPLLDAPSARCLRLLVPALSGRRTGLIATAPAAAVGAPGAEMRELRLSPLDDHAATALLAARAPWLSRRDAARVTREAEGLPLALWELPLGPDDRPGARLASMCRDRVGALPEAARRLLLLACLADGGDLDLLLGAGAPVPEELRAADRSGLVTLLDRHVDVAPAVRAAVLAASTVTQRREAHSHLAAASTVPPERGSPGRSEGRRIADRTLHEPPGARRSAHAAYVAAAVGGDLTSVAAHPVDTPSGSLWTAVARAHVLLHGDGDLDAAHRVLVAAVEALDADGAVADESALTAAFDTLIAVCRFADRQPLWASLRKSYLRHGARLPTRTALSVRGGISREPVTAVPADPLSTLRSAWSSLAVHGVTGQGPALRGILEEGLRGGAAGPAMSAAVLLSLDAFVAGRWDDSAEAGLQGRRLCEAHGHETLAVLSAAGPALVAACRGDEVSWQGHTRRMLGWAAPRGAGLLHRYATYARVLAAAGRGDAETAYQNACLLTRRWVSDLEAPAPWLLWDLVDAAVRARRHEEAAAHVRAARESGMADVPGRAALLLAGAAARVGQGDDARRLYEEALAVSGAEEWPFDVARVQLAYGEHLRRSRSALAARLPLTSSLATFRRLDAVPWAIRAETELRAAGDRTAGPQGAGPASLTHQERTVAGLAATGATNREIGQRLGLSPRTVGSHLSRVFHKLGLTSRAGLAEALRATDGR